MLGTEQSSVGAGWSCFINFKDRQWAPPLPSLSQVWTAALQGAGHLADSQEALFAGRGADSPTFYHSL